MGFRRRERTIGWVLQQLMEGVYVIESERNAEVEQVREEDRYLQGRQADLKRRGK